MAEDSDGENDTYVTIGTAFDVPEDNEPLKKPSKVEDQIAVDKQGRKRFHGAFTGGFSAGYFNSVGSKEGWTPSTFVSSRSNRREKNNDGLSKPEDFMDDEDFTEHGIAPRQLKTTSPFKSTKDEISERKRQLQKQVDEGDLQSAIPGGMVLDDMVMPSTLSIGIKLLRSMGWKQGQGVGEKTEIHAPTKVESTKKVYGCMRPEEGESLDMSSLKNLLAPKDVVAISFERKDNFHGIGYSGIDPYSAMYEKNSTKEEQPKSFRPTGREKRGIRGQAFGVGVFEEEDDDIYGHDNLSNYDISMSQEDENDTHGWSGAPKNEKSKGCLNGFVKSKKVMKPSSFGTMITIPSGYIPRHTFDEDKQFGNNSTADVNARHQMSSKDRSLLLGETTKTLNDVNQWALRWDKKPDISEQIKETTSSSVDDSDKKDNNNRFSSRWDKEIHQERPKQQTVKEPHEPNAPVYDPDTKTFRPFAKYPLKQARYEEFLRAKKNGHKPELTYDRSVTEWERERELDEFSRASVLYRPLSNTFSNRFTPATNRSDESANQAAAKDDEDNLPSDKKAAKMGMFGRLTRTTLEWHPEKLLCKRFNIPDPYPHSILRGVPGRGRKTRSSIFETDVEMLEASNIKESGEGEQEKDFTEKLKTGKTPQQKNKIKIGPLSHLNQKQIGNDASIAPSLTQLDANYGKNSKDKGIKPTIDIFKAIFDNSDSSESDDSEDAEDENTKTSENNGNNIIQVVGNAFDNQQTAHNQLKETDSDKTENATISHNENHTVEKKLNENTENVTKEKYDDTKRNSKPMLPLSMLNKKRDVTKSSSTNTFQSSKNSKCNEEPQMKANKNSYSKHSDNGDKYAFGVDKHSCDRDNDENEHRKHSENKHDSSGDNASNEWEESSSRKSSKKKKKKHKKEKKYNEEKYKKRKKDKSSKRDKSSRRDRNKRDNKRTSSANSSSDEVSLVPSNTLLLEKLKQVQSKLKKRPSAADFM